VNLFRNSLGTVASLALAVLLIAPAAEASRSGLPAALAPVLGAPATPDQILEAELTEPPERLRLFDDLRLPERPLELVEARKTASGSSTYTLGLNVWQTGDLSQECSGLSFQGLWTDPVTGIAYARNRWYDARTASWLSEDPMGAVDSPNLYAFVGWGPHMYTDPYGYWSWDPASGYRWVQARVGEAKDFYSSSDSVALDAVGNTLSDLGGGIGSVLNIGTNTGETYVEEGGFHDLESTALITAAGLGDLSETILAATGAASTAVKTAQTVRQVQQLRRIKRELQAATSSEQTGELLAQRELVRRGFDIGPDVKIRGKQGEGAGNQGVDLVFERKNVISPDKSITVESKSVNFPELKNDTRQIQQATDEFNRTRLDRAADPRLSSPDTIREATRLQELREANRLKSYKSVYDPVSGTVKFYEVVSDESGTQVLEEVTTRLLSTGF